MRTKKKVYDGPAVVGFDFASREARETTAANLYAQARSARTAVEMDWVRCNDYYNFIHDAAAETIQYCKDQDLPWVPAGIPDPWIMVESQVDPNLPEPEFRGRDDDMDSSRARRREYAVRYIMEANRLKDKNTRNERRLLKYGDAFWKAYWDADLRCGLHEGDIRVEDLPVETIYPDPSLRGGSIQDGQFLVYIYRLHRVAFANKFRADLQKRGVAPSELADERDTPLFDVVTALDEYDNTVQVMEFWFKQPEDTKDTDGSTVPAGSVACSIQAGGKELRYIPHYWKRTGKQNQLFPFVQYWRIQDENRVWNKSELFPILDLVDAADRKLAAGLLNDAFMANDIVLVEDGALSEGSDITNEPGSVVRLKANRINGVRRMGGLQPMQDIQGSMAWFKEQIERANRNYETNLGREGARQITATGMSMLRSDAKDQSDIKKADRNGGFERLYELLDWLALEFFDDQRMIYLGADEDHGREAPVAFPFNADDMSVEMPAVRDMLTGEVVREEWTYWPKVDVTISAGDSVVKGKVETLQALQALTQAQITAENWKLYAAQLEILDVPGKQEIVNDWKQRFEAPQMPAMPGMGQPAAPMQGMPPAMPAEML